MASSLTDRIKRAWNVFRSGEDDWWKGIGAASSIPRDRVRLNIRNERTIIAGIYTRIGIDVAAVKIHHVRKDINGRYTETIDSALDQRLNLAANSDQTGRAFIQDAAMSLFDEGCIAIVPVETSSNPARSGSYDILSLRVGRIVEWFPAHVRVDIYNEWTGEREQVILKKSEVAIVQNPLYSVMNEPNSTLQRLNAKLALLDKVDEQSGAQKLDLIIQLPYTIKSEARRAQAEKRRKEIEVQLAESKYGIAYADGTERITQLNRPVENNLLEQVKELTESLYNQLGLTKEVFDGTADDKAMLNYYNRTVEPVVAAICNAMEWKFLTKTARTQGQGIMYFNDPFRLVPVSDLAEIADKLTRNEILSSNEVRALMGYRPYDDPRADELRNKNLNESNSPDQYFEPAEEAPYDEELPYDEEVPYDQEPMDEPLF